MSFCTQRSLTLDSLEWQTACLLAIIRDQWQEKRRFNFSSLSLSLSLPLSCSYVEFCPKGSRGPIHHLNRADCYFVTPTEHNWEGAQSACPPAMTLAYATHASEASHLKYWMKETNTKPVWTAVKYRQDDGWYDALTNEYLNYPDSNFDKSHPDRIQDQSCYAVGAAGLQPFDCLERKKVLCRAPGQFCLLSLSLGLLLSRLQSTLSTLEVTFFLCLYPPPPPIFLSVSLSLRDWHASSHSRTAKVSSLLHTSMIALRIRLNIISLQPIENGICSFETFCNESSIYTLPDINIKPF